MIELITLGLLLIIASIAYYLQIRLNKIDDDIENIECRLEIIHALLLDLQPKSDIELPVRLPEDVLEDMLGETVNEMFDHQIDKKQHQEIMKIIKNKY